MAQMYFFSEAYLDTPPYSLLLQSAPLPHHHPLPLFPHSVYPTALIFFLNTIKCTYLLLFYYCCLSVLEYKLYMVKDLLVTGVSLE